MNNSKTDPAASGRFDILETCWLHLNWVQRKSLRIKITVAVFIIHHIEHIETLHDRINMKINRFVLSWIFPAHWV